MDDLLQDGNAIAYPIQAPRFRSIYICWVTNVIKNFPVVFAFHYLVHAGYMHLDIYSP